MKKQFTLSTTTIKTLLTAALTWTTLGTHAIDINTVPEADANARVGAYVPFTRYDCNQNGDATLGGGASIHSSTGIHMTDIAAQASEHAYVKLPSNGSYVEWTVKRTGNAVTMRFTMPDATKGTDGRTGSLDVYVNGVKTNIFIHGNEKSSIPLSSRWMWQYFDKNVNGKDAKHTDNASDEYIAGATACFAFDQIGFVLPTMLKVGDKIRIQSTNDGNMEYGVDFIEIEKAVKKECPAGYISAAGTDNLQQFINNNKGKKIYVPEGEWVFGSAVYPHVAELPDNTTVMGAGIFYTNIHFANAGQRGGGVNIRNNSELSDIHLTAQLNSRLGQAALYKGLQAWPNGFFGHDLWIQHFECGAWFDGGNNIRVVNCRLTDNYADGLNFCQGASNSTAYNNIVRNNGDDGLAMWNYENEEYHNRFCYNTIEFGWRAGGIGIFGGVGHRIYNNLIVHCPYCAGIRVNTDFPGLCFTNTGQESIRFENNTVICSGADVDIFGNQLPSVDLRNNYTSSARDHEVKNVLFENTKISRSHWQDVRNTTGLSFSYTAISQAEEPDLLPFDPDLVDEYTGFTGNLELEGLAWQNAEGSTTLTQDDVVTFTVKVTNTGSEALPAGAPLAVSLTIDGSTQLTTANYTEGLAVGASTRFTLTWTATSGGHTVKASLDPNGLLPNESDDSDNSRTKRLNVTAKERTVNTNYTATSGIDFYVTDVTYYNVTKSEWNGSISEGDLIQFRAHVVNAGSSYWSGGDKCGLQFRIDGAAYPALITWNDKEYGPWASHAFKEMDATGGNSYKADGNTDSSKGLYWKATTGSHSVTAYIDDDGKISESNENNNMTTVTLPTIPYVVNPSFDTTDEPDNLDGAATVDVTIVAAVGRSTLYYGTQNLKVPAGVVAYTLNLNGAGQFVRPTTYNPGEIIPAGTAVVVEGPAATYAFTVTSQSGKQAGGASLLYGFDTDTYITAPANSRYYVLTLSKSGTNPGFYYKSGCPDGGAFTSAGHKAYLAVPRGQQAKEGFALDDVATAIARPATAAAVSSEETVYDLQGRRVKAKSQQLPKGIYVVNGRKMVK